MEIVEMHANEWRNNPQRYSRFISDNAAPLSATFVLICPHQYVKCTATVGNESVEIMPPTMSETEETLQEGGRRVHQEGKWLPQPWGPNINRWPDKEVMFTRARGEREREMHCNFLQATTMQTAARMTIWLTVGVAILSALPACQAQLTDAEKREAVQFSNFLRRNTVPRAGDMNGLVWNDRLAGLAQSAADQCKYQHYYNGEYAGLGENVYKGGKRNLTEILMFMYLERENYAFKTGSCNINSGRKYPMFGTCGHYLQLVSASIMHIGCGLKQCSDGSYLVFCEYNGGYASPPYSAGKPGTQCHHMYASYSQDGLCYYKPVLGAAPVNGTLDCNITCLNYGNKTHNQYQCACTCPRGFFGSRCERHIGGGTARSVPNDCKAQLVTCKNGGTPTMSGSVCKCACPASYRGDECEENIGQMEHSIYWNFGQDMRYASYYPVDPKIWTSKLIENTVLYYLTTELNSHCKANYKSCCPGSASSTTSADFVAYADFYVTDTFPRQELDGSLKVGVHYRMPAAATKTCTGSYVSRSALLAAAAKAHQSVKTFLETYMHVKVIKFE